MGDSSCTSRHPVNLLLDALLGLWFDPDLIDLTGAFAKCRRRALAYGKCVERLRTLEEKNTEAGLDSGSSSASEARRKFEARSARFTDNQRALEILLGEIQTKLRCCAEVRKALLEGGGLVWDATEGQRSLKRSHEIMVMIEKIETFLRIFESDLTHSESMIGLDTTAHMYQADTMIGSVVEKLFAAVEFGNAGLLPSLSDTLDCWRHEMNDRIDAVKTSWIDVQTRLVMMRDRGDAYSSIGKLATLLNCSRATIHRAIEDSDTLKGWQARRLGAKGSPRAGGLNEVVMDRTEQAREADPAEEAESDDADVVFAQLIQEASDNERAILNGMTPEERDHLTGLKPKDRLEYLDLRYHDPDTNDKILGRRA